MENVMLPTYYNYLLKRSHQHKILHEKFLKPNKNLHYTSAKLYYYFENDYENNFDKISNILTANLNLYKQDIIDDLSLTENLYEINSDGSYTISKNNLNYLILDNEKEISSFSLDKLKEIYTKKYEEFEKDNIDKPFVDNLFDHYETTFRESLENQNKDIVRIYNEMNKTEQKMDSLSYNEYKRSGVDYFDVTKKSYNNLLNNLNKQVELKINLKRYNDQIDLDEIIWDTIKNLKDVYETRSKNIFNKLYLILLKNKTVTNHEENYLKIVDDYLAYLNFAILNKNNSDQQFYILQKILRGQYKGNLEDLHSLFKKYGYVNKQTAIEFCEDIGDVNSTACLSYQKRNGNLSVTERLAYIFSDVILNIKFKNILKNDIEKGDCKNLVKHLKEYDAYPIAEFKYESVVMLNMYAITHIINEKIYEDYLNNLERLKH